MAKRQIKEIIIELEQFNLTGEYMVRLGRLTDEVMGSREKGQALPAMFGILERFPDEELGSPGPLVHAIEKCSGYEGMLVKSIQQQPAGLTIWMLYRLIQRDPQVHYIEALREVLNHPLTSEVVKEDAEILLSWIE